jgi:hypothetical protein
MVFNIEWGFRPDWSTLGNRYAFRNIFVYLGKVNDITWKYGILKDPFDIGFNRNDNGKI